MKIINENNRVVSNNIEIVEQELVKKYVKPEDIVLELGARYGAVSITTNKIVNDKSSHYVVEPDEKVWDALGSNMKNNNCDFNIIKGVIGKEKYKISGSNYSTFTEKDLNGTIKNYDIPDVKFNTLIVDCEGYLEIFYDENKEFFTTLEKIILEADEIDRCNYDRVFDEFIKIGFHQIEKIKEPTCDNMYHYVFVREAPKEKVLICSLSDRPLLSKPMFDQLEEYCNLHKYKCVLETELLTRSRAPSWSKILLLQREMKNNPDIDLIVWIDDDILITNKIIKIEELIENYEFNKVLVSEDVVWSPFNCGVLVCKNNQDTYDYFTHIWDLCEKYPEKKFSGLWEQDIMVKDCQLTSVMNPNEPMPVTIIPHNIIQSFYRDHDLPANKKWKLGHFAAHFTGMSLEKRIEKRNEIIKLIN